MQFTKQITSAITAGALVLSMATPAFAADVEILGNGAGSQNNVNQTTNNNTTVSQTNTAVVSNVVTTNSNSGGNNANFNTGGDTTVVSGAAKSNATVTTAVNANQAQVTPCNCVAGTGNSTEISGNGAGSFNNANSTQNNNTALGQGNNAVVTNLVNGNANSGNNGANFNTGGTTTVVSGPAESNVSVLNAANANVASVGAAAGVGTGVGTSALITGNGAGSQNNINLTKNNNVFANQGNSAILTNIVTSNANSGGNNANFNTGGTTAVIAGPATANAAVTNLANFNNADLSGCGCATGNSLFKIAGNGAGAGSFNNINSTSNNNSALGQGNFAFLLNPVLANANSGANGATFNVGAVGNDDPVVVSNTAWSSTTVSNVANLNNAAVGQVALPGGGSANLVFNLAVLLALLQV